MLDVRCVSVIRRYVVEYGTHDITINCGSSMLSLTPCDEHDDGSALVLEYEYYQVLVVVQKPHVKREKPTGINKIKPHVSLIEKNRRRRGEVDDDWRLV
jgi:hypothetical protein